MSVCLSVFISETVTHTYRDREREREREEKERREKSGRETGVREFACMCILY